MSVELSNACGNAQNATGPVQIAARRDGEQPLRARGSTSLACILGDLRNGTVSPIRRLTSELNPHRSVFQFVLAVDAIYNRNTIQIFGLVIFNLLFLAYAIMSISEVRNAFENIGKLQDNVEIYITVVPCMIGLAQAVFCVCSWFIFREFGWEVFKHLGADRRIKRMYMAYQVFICICKCEWRLQSVFND
jgi:hypothetical protein